MTLPGEKFCFFKNDVSGLTCFCSYSWDVKRLKVRRVGWMQGWKSGFRRGVEICRSFFVYTSCVAKMDIRSSTDVVWGHQVENLGFGVQALWGLGLRSGNKPALSIQARSLKFDPPDRP